MKNTTCDFQLPTKECRVTEAYESPIIEVIEVSVEKGFAQSLSNGSFTSDWGSGTEIS